VPRNHPLKSITAILFLATAWTVCLIGCSPKVSYVSKYGTAYDPERAKRGIPTIPPNWKVEDLGQSFSFSDPSPNMAAPHRLGKSVSIDKNGKVFSETDNFYSGKTFIRDPEKGTLFEEVTITYWYSQEATGKAWSAMANLSSDRFPVEISIERADLILKSWGLHR
jgi:hypothetical protein